MAKILIAGDYCPHHRVADMLSKNDFSFFDNVRDVVSQVDYSIVNFECPVVVGNVNPIKKTGPALRTIPAAVDALKYAGFDCVTLANNHFRDFGDDGCSLTIKTLTDSHIDFVGGGYNIKEAQTILYKIINGKKIAIVNFCENEFSIATEVRAGAAPMDAVDNYNQITEARRNADYVIVIVHGGHEHYQLPSPRMKKLYRHYITIGADAVVNHHQHCYSGYEYFNGKPILYGLGNFCFDWKDETSIWKEGFMVNISFDNEKIDIELIPYNQGREIPAVILKKENSLKDFYSRILSLNTIIEDDTLLKESFAKWCSKRSNTVNNIFNSYNNRYLNAAANRGWIRRPASHRDISAVYNYIICEAHRDITLNVLFNEFGDNE